MRNHALIDVGAIICETVYNGKYKHQKDVGDRF